MRKFIVCLALLIAGAIVFIACQKNNNVIKQASTTAQIKEHFKTSYENQKPAKSGRDILGTATPDWNKTEFDATNHFVFAPILLEATNCSKILAGEVDEAGNISNLCYYIVINKNSSTFNPANLVKEVLENKKNIQGAFSGAVLKYSLNNELIYGRDFKEGMQTKKNNTLTRKSPTNTNGYNMPPPDDCMGDWIATEWWRVTFDENGYIIDEEYLYTTYYCSDWGGGGNQGASCQQTANEIFETASTLAEKVSVEDCGSTGSTRYRCYTWKIYTVSNGMIPMYLKSKDKATQVLGQDNRWRFSSLIHDGIIKSGTEILYSVSTENVSPTSTITSHLGVSDQVGKMHLSFTVKVSVICDGLPIVHNDPTSTEMSWYVNE